MDNTLTSIIREKRPCVFISPHFDDAAFSAGGILTMLSSHVPCTVINVFTTAGNGRSTLSAKTFLRQCNAPSAESLYQTREKEDAAALQKIHTTVYNLGFADALWRGVKHTGLSEQTAYYPTYRFHVQSGRLSPHDHTTRKAITKRLTDILSQIHPSPAVFCPIGFGGHVDHILTRDAAIDACREDSLIFWSDKPYDKTIHANDTKIAPLYEPAFEFSIEGDAKKHLCEAYQSQFYSVYQDKMDVFRTERFFRRIHDDKQTTATVSISSSLTKTLLTQWRQLWNNAPTAHIYNSPDWFLAASQTFPHRGILIISVFDKNKLRAILPLVKSSVFGMTTYTPAGSVHADKAPLLLSSEDPTLYTLIGQGIEQSCDRIYLPELSEIAARYLPTSKRTMVIPVSTGRIAPLSPTDVYTTVSSKTKKAIEKSLTSLGMTFTSHLETGSMKQLYEHLSEIEQQSHKRHDYTAVLNDKRYEGLLAAMPSSSVLVNVLYANGKAICYQFGFIAKHVLHWVQTAYIESYKPYSPGKLLMYLVLPQLSDIGIRTIDYSRGDGDYKRAFAPATYTQYAMFSADNIFVVWYWKIINTAIQKAFTHKYFYNKIRILKNKIVRHFSTP